jgi:hypothetical protein
MDETKLENWSAEIPRITCTHGREESVDSRASEPEWRIRGANILETDLEVQDGGADKGRNECGCNLHAERVPWVDLHVVRQLEILGELGKRMVIWLVTAMAFSSDERT